MKKLNRKLFAVIMAIAVMAASAGTVPARAASKKKPSLSKKSVTLTITKKKSPSANLKVKNAGAKKMKWKISNAKIVSIKAGKNNSVKVVGKKAGKATVTCRVGGKKLTCKVTVKDKRKTDSSNNSSKAKNAAAICETRDDHDWVEKWAVFEKEGDYIYRNQGSNEYYSIYPCVCGKVFYSFEEYQRHDMVVNLRMPGCEKSNKAGLHGTSAKGEPTYTYIYDDDGADILHINWRREYIEYHYCSKCGERVYGGYYNDSKSD